MKRSESGDGQQSEDNFRKKQKNEVPTNLLEAIKANSPFDEIQKIIDLGVNLEEKDNEGQTALMHTLINNNLAVAKILIYAGADITAVDSEQNSVLTHAVSHTSDLGFVDDLLKRGADVNAQNKNKDTALLIACQEGNINFVPLLIKHGANLSQCNEFQETSLMLATQSGSSETIQILLSAGANVNSKDDKGETALFKIQNEESFFILMNAKISTNHINDNGDSVVMALVKRNPHLVQCIKHILQTDVNPSILDDKGNSPLMEACKHVTEHLELVKLLHDKGSNPSRQNQRGHSALTFAVSRQHVETIKLLLSIGANPSASDAKGVSLLAQICRRKEENLEILNLFLEAGANVKSQDKYGQTALMFAIKNDHLNYVKRLLEFGANPSTQARKGTSALIQVCQMKRENLELVEILIKAGANTSAQNMAGNTPLMFALKNKHYNITELLLKHGANIHTQNRSGKNLLMLACRGKRDINIDYVKLFLDHGINVSAHDVDGDTAAIFAIENKNFKILTLLIKAGANILAQNNCGWTLLTVAARRGHMKTAKYLLKKGARVSTFDVFGENAVVAAAEQNRFEMVFLLLDHGARPILKDCSVINQISNNFMNDEINEEDFKETIFKVLEYTPEIDCSLVVYEMIRAYLGLIPYVEQQDSNFKILLKFIQEYVENATKKVEKSNMLIHYQSDIHKAIMNAISKCYNYNDNVTTFKNIIKIFDIVLKSPFKDINWNKPISTSLENSSFSCINGEIALTETVGFLISSFYENLEDDEFSETEFLTTKNMLQDLLDNGFSIDSVNTRVMSPFSILMSLGFHSPQDQKHTLEIAKDWLRKGIQKSQRLLSFEFQEHIELSQQLQLPDALWFAFHNGNSAMMPYLLPYWSAPPLTLLLFIPPLRRFTLRDVALAQDMDKVHDSVKEIYPCLVEIGGPLPPGHQFIPTIQQLLDHFSIILDNASELADDFRKLHSVGPPSLRQLCRHIIRSGYQSGDDLPQRLLSSLIVPHGLKDFLLLSEKNDLL